MKKSNLLSVVCVAACLSFPFASFAAEDVTTVSVTSGELRDPGNTTVIREPQPLPEPGKIAPLPAECIADPASCDLTEEQVAGKLACQQDFNSEACVLYRQTFESMPVKDACKESVGVKKMNRFRMGDGVLSVAELQIDNGPMFYNVQLKLDFASGQFRILGLSERPEPIKIQMGCPFSLKVTDYARLEGTNLGIRSLGIISDSRCPTDATCVQAGSVTVGLEAVREGMINAGEFNLTLGDDPTTATRDLGGYVLTLVSVKPVPSSAEAIDEKEYTVTLRLTPATSE